MSLHCSDHLCCIPVRAKKMRESGYVANRSQMIQIAVRPRAATFPQLQKNAEKPLFFALLRESGYVANMSQTIQIAARLRAANFLQLRKKILKNRYFLLSKLWGKK